MYRMLALAAGRLTAAAPQAAVRRLRPRGRRGTTLIELLVAMVSLTILGSGTFMVYFTVTNLYRTSIWRLPPYDEATLATDRLASELRKAMLILDHEAEWIVVVIPETDDAGDYRLVTDGDNIVLQQGRQVAFYLSDETGAPSAEGTVMWKAVKNPGETEFTPVSRLAENIRPDLNPADPETGQSRPLFKYWPDVIRLDGIELWVTSATTDRGVLRTQAAHAEVYLRNK